MTLIPTLFRRVATLILAAALVPAPAARAQGTCPAAWLPGSAGPGANMTVRASTMWDPDGPGPLPARLVIGGTFSTVAGLPAQGLASYDFTAGQWSAFGSSISGVVFAVAALPNGDLIVGGQFGAAGGISAGSIAHWSAASGQWVPMAGTDGYVYGLGVTAAGDVIVGGSFAVAGGVPVHNIARWTPASGLWSAIGSGVTSPVNVVLPIPSGDIYAGYSNGSQGGVTRWSNAQSQWQGYGFGGVNTGAVLALARLANGDIIVGGMFTDLLGVGFFTPYIARLNDSGIYAMGAGMDGAVRSLTVAPNGDVIAGGDFSVAGSVGANHAARWNGAAWSALGSGATDSVNTLTSAPGGAIVAGGTFLSAGGRTVNRVASWDGAGWSSLGPGINGMVDALQAMPDGDLIAAGDFTHIGTVNANRIARLSGSAWSPMGSGMDNLITSLSLAPNGDVIAGGLFTTAGGTGANQIARWNGSAWTPLGTGIDNSGWVYAVQAMPNGDVYAGGFFGSAGGVNVSHIARWNGSAWSALTSGCNLTVQAMAVTNDGRLLVGGSFYVAGGLSCGRIAAWNGSAWSVPGGTGMNDNVLAITCLPSGEVVAGGLFTTASGQPAPFAARMLPGGPWQAAGGASSLTPDSPVRALAAHPNTSAIAAGDFTYASGNVCNHVARWNTSAWNPLGGGVNGPGRAVAVLPNGDVAVGGDFTAADGSTSVAIARYTFGGTAASITQQPAPASACGGGSAPVSVVAAGTAPFAYQWQIQTAAGAWANLSAAPTSLPCGGSAQTPAATSASTSISIIPCAGVSQYQVRCLVTNTCGSVASNAATIAVCYANCDCSTTAPALNVLDFACFLNKFASGDPAANCDGSTAPPVLNVLDFACFLNTFAAGCP